MPKEWRQAGERTKSGAIINKKLLEQKSKIYELLNDFQKENKPVSAAILKDFLTGKTEIKARSLEFVI